MVLNERRRAVLNALVKEYIRSGEPVGSRQLVERYAIACSSATVRNELAALEESGHVYQPHTSSGRIPTDMGYRAFVDGLLESGEQFTDVDSSQIRIYDHEFAYEFDDLIRQTLMVLSHVTHYVAVVLAPALSLARIRRIDLVSMSQRRAVVVLITAGGQVVNRYIELVMDVMPERLAGIEQMLNAALCGKRAAQVRALRLGIDSAADPDGLVTDVVDAIIGCLEDADRDRLYHCGVPELLTLPEFAESSRLRPLLGLLDDGLAMLDALSEVASTGGLTVRIGSENTRSELCGMSLVATNYAATDADGIVGVIGPTRMDYSRTIAAVRGVAGELSTALMS